MLEIPLYKRRDFLTKLVIPKETFIEILDHKEGETSVDVITYLDELMLKQEEGMVVKNPNSEYIPADRGDNWLKIKADYIDYIKETLDVLIVGGFYGEGRRAGKLSHFMYAVIDDRDGKKNDNVRDIKWLTLGKVGSGYTDEQLLEISMEHRNVWKPYNARSPPSWFIHSPRGEKPDMIIDPSDSVVVTISCYELVPSDQYECQYTARFPRFKSLREDKGPEDCMKYSEVHEFIQNTSGRMHHQKRLLADEYLESTQPKPKRKLTRNISKSQIENEYIGVDVTSVEKTGELFSGLVFCVMPDSIKTEIDAQRLSKHDVEALILQNGGEIMQNAILDQTNYVVADKTSMDMICLILAIKVQNLMKSKKFDVVKASWILKCIESGSIQALRPAYFIWI
jgi:DNA ligase-4